MITITALKWVPPFAQGQVRDHRVRWMLNEVGWPYKVRLIDTEVQQSAAYRADQPFGQVPVMEEEGRPTLFETGAILLDVAMRTGKLLPGDEKERSLAVCWLFAALNSLEPALANLAEVDFFIKDEAMKAKRRPDVLRNAQMRLSQLSSALGERPYFVGESFTVADLMVASVLKIGGHTGILDAFPNMLGFRDRCFVRPAYQKAIADQCADIARHSPKDMKYELRQNA
ncbi:MAG TPA: glutathione S-transferase family protein [Mesorhizobium sp.]|jgi:glutathione S-transferase|nr:glutathione S-transferase family protein [Mesorhizobium sp.]